MTDFGFFGVCGYKVVSERMHSDHSTVQAIVEVRVGATCVRRAAEGTGPVHALDNALRRCLTKDFPDLERVRLSDYTVTVVDASTGTGAEVRVSIEATDGVESWTVDAISANIVDASFEALCAASVMGIERAKVPA